MDLKVFEIFNLKKMLKLDDLNDLFKNRKENLAKLDFSKYESELTDYSNHIIDIEKRVSTFMSNMSTILTTRYGNITTINNIFPTSSFKRIKDVKYTINTLTLETLVDITESKLKGTAYDVPIFTHRTSKFNSEGYISHGIIINYLSELIEDEFYVIKMRDGRFISSKIKGNNNIYSTKINKAINLYYVYIGETMQTLSAPIAYKYNKVNYYDITKSPQSLIETFYQIDIEDIYIGVTSVAFPLKVDYKLYILDVGVEYKILDNSVIRGCKLYDSENKELNLNSTFKNTGFIKVNFLTDESFIEKLVLEEVI